MIVSRTLMIMSIIYCSFLNLLFFIKARVRNVETKLYSYMLVSNLLGLIIELSSSLTLEFFPSQEFLALCLMKSFLIYLSFFATINTFYVLIISRFYSKSNDYAFFKKINLFFIIIMIINVFLIVILPLEYVNDGKSMYSYGPGANFSYIYGMITGTISILIFLLFRNKQISIKKYYPLMIFIVGGLIMMLIQKTNPSITLMSSIETFVLLAMYFTIENPDVKMINALEVAKKQADEANQAKSEFLASMSHEIRTPLNAIVGFSQALETEDISDSAREEVNDIITSSNTLLEIVNGILDISKIEANKIEIIEDNYSFEKIFDELVSLSKARMGESTLDFRYSLDPTMPPVLYGDHSRVKQVILNILTNSIKYTKNGYIDFKATCVTQGDICRVIVSVEDTGIGIKQDHINRLFSKFDRLGVEKEITIEGTGLGLAITKRLVELMNGTIVVQSIYGEGSKFTIALDQRIVRDVSVEEVYKKYTTNTVRMIDCSDKKILLVDDNMVNIKVAQRLLRDYKVQIDAVQSGPEAINKVSVGIKYDLILMDDLMPKMSGVEALHELQKIPGFNIPTVALTANAINGMREKYLAEGFNDYLAKPIKKEELNAIMVKFLDKK